MRIVITSVLVSLLVIVAWIAKSNGMIGVAGLLIGLAGYFAGYCDAWNARNRRKGM